MQLTNTPLHVKDPIRLEESMKNFHHARTVGGSGASEQAITRNAEGTPIR
jgi:hypothetical protein